MYLYLCACVYYKYNSSNIYISLSSSCKILLSLPECGQVWSFCLNHPYVADNPVLNLKLKDKCLHYREKLWLGFPLQSEKRECKYQVLTSWDGAAVASCVGQCGAGAGPASPPTEVWRAGVSGAIVHNPVLKCRPFQKCPSLWMVSCGSVVSRSAHVGWGLKWQLISWSRDAAVVWFFMGPSVLSLVNK